MDWIFLLANPPPPSVRQVNPSDHELFELLFFPFILVQVHLGFICPKPFIPEVDSFKCILENYNLAFLSLSDSGGLHLVVNPLHLYP